MTTLIDLGSRYRVVLSIGIAVFVVVTGARFVGLLEPLELAAYDQFLRTRSTPLPGDSPIVLIRIREDEIRRFGHPLCDDLLARAVMAIGDEYPSLSRWETHTSSPVPLSNATNPLPAGPPTSMSSISPSTRGDVLKP